MQPVEDDKLSEVNDETPKLPRIFRDRWYAKTGAALANEVWLIADSLVDNQKWRGLATKEMIELYDGRLLMGQMDYGACSLQDFGNGTDGELSWNVTKSACDSVVAEISGRQKPMAKFQTQGAGWKTKRKAKKLEKFCLGVMNQRQGPYLNSWELMEETFRDSTVVEFGIAKVFWDGEKVALERHYCWEFYVDPVDAKYGQPKSLFHVRTMERDLAIWTFAYDPELDLTDERRSEIALALMQAPEVAKESLGSFGQDRSAKSIRIVEAWRLKIGKTPGKHCFAIGECCLHEEVWERSTFPFIRMRWDRDMIGWGGRSLASNGRAIHLEINENTMKLQERFRICGAKRTFYVQGSVDEELLQSNEQETFIPVQPGMIFPAESIPHPINESELQWMGLNFEKYYEIQGVSQLKAASRKEPGIDSAIGLRTLNDMSSSRFSVKAKMYENSFVDLAYQIIATAKDAYEGGAEVIVRERDAIDFGDVDLPEDMLDISVSPASSLPNDPAGRMQHAQELFGAGIITTPVYKELLNWPDLEKEMDYQTSQRRYLEKVIDGMLDAQELDQPEKVMPDPLLPDKLGAMVQAAQAYFDALYNDAPEYNLQLLRDYMSALDQIIAITMMGQQQMGAAPGAPAGGPGGQPAQPSPGDQPA